MVEKLQSPEELRAHARRHRAAAMAADDPRRRGSHLLLAEEYDKLAAAVETERMTASMPERS